MSAVTSDAGATVYELLQTEFEEVQKSLKHVEENIRRLTGREPDEYRAVGVKRPNFAVNNTDKARGTSSPALLDARHDVGSSGDRPPLKRKLLGSAFTRLGTVEENQKEDEESGDEDSTLKKPTLQSSVVATPKEVRSRRDTIEEQKNDRRGMERNRRMFGMILGTLQKFQNEESRRKEQSQKRAEIEQKLEAAAEKEKEELRKERQDLFLARREKQAHIRRLEQKMELAKMHDKWESKQKLLLNFLQTKAKPCIMFLPAKSNAESLKRLKETQQKIESIIQTHRTKIEEELKEIDELYRKGNIETEEADQGETVLDKENRGPLEARLSDTQEDVGDVEQPVVEDSNHTGMESVDTITETDDKPDVSTVEQPAEEITKKEGDKVLDVLGDQEFEPIYDE